MSSKLTAVQRQAQNLGYKGAVPHNASSVTKDDNGIFSVTVDGKTTKYNADGTPVTNNPPAADNNGNGNNPPRVDGNNNNNDNGNGNNGNGAAGNGNGNDTSIFSMNGGYTIDPEKFASAAMNLSSISQIAQEMPFGLGGQLSKNATMKAVQDFMKSVSFNFDFSKMVAQAQNNNQFSINLNNNGTTPVPSLNQSQTVTEQQIQDLHITKDEIKAAGDKSKGNNAKVACRYVTEQLLTKLGLTNLSEAEKVKLQAEIIRSNPDIFKSHSGNQYAGNLKDNADLSKLKLPDKAWIEQNIKGKGVSGQVLWVNNGNYAVVNGNTAKYYDADGSEISAAEFKKMNPWFANRVDELTGKKAETEKKAQENKKAKAKESINKKAADMAQRAYVAMKGAGTDHDELKKIVFNEVNKDNVIEMMDAWDKGFKDSMGGESFIESMQGEFHSGMFDDRQIKHENKILNALVARAEKLGLHSEAATAKGIVESEHNSTFYSSDDTVRNALEKLVQQIKAKEAENTGSTTT